MSLAICEVPVHPVQFLSESDLSTLPVLPMTQDSDGTYFCDGESTQDGTPSPDNPVPIINTYPAGTYKAICGGKVYKITLEEDLRSVPGVADRVRIDAGKGVCWVEWKVNAYTITGNETWSDNYYPTIHASINIPLGIFKTPIVTNHCYESFDYTNKSGKTFGFRNCDTYWNFANADECKAWLKEKYDSGNPMYFYYALADPTTHQSIPIQLTTITSGRSVTIERTVNDAVDMLAVKGDSWQLVQEQGKNLMPFPYDTGTCDVHGISFVVNDDGSITANGTATDNAYFYFRTSSNPITLKAGTYSASQGDNKNTSADGYKIFLRKNGGEILNLGTGDKTFELSDDAEIYAYINVNSGVTLENVVFKFMINAGGTVLPYEPFTPAMPSPEYPSEVVSVEGEMESSGWNLCPIKDITTKESNTGTIILEITEHGTYTLSADVTKYSDDSATNTRCTIRIYYTDGTYNQKMSEMDASNQERDGIRRRKSVSVTSDRSKNISYIRLITLHYGSSNGTRNAKAENIQLIRGTEQKLYDRHRGNSITLPVLRGLPDGTADVLYVDRKAKRAWVERCVGEFKARSTDKRVLATIFTAGFYDKGNSTNVGYTLKDSRKGLSNKNYYGYCNCLSHHEVVWSIASEIGYTFNNNQIHMRFPNTVLGVSDDATSDEKKQAWIDYVNGRYNAGNPIVVLYPLAEPTIEELPYSDYLLLTAQYETNIHIDCDEHLEPEIVATVKVLGR